MGAEGKGRLLWGSLLRGLPARGPEPPDVPPPSPQSVASMTATQVGVCRALTVPPEPLELPLAADPSVTVTIAPPVAHTGPGPIHMRLLSYQLREGQVRGWGGAGGASRNLGVHGGSRCGVRGVENLLGRAVCWVGTGLTRWGGAQWGVPAGGDTHTAGVSVVGGQAGGPCHGGAGQGLSGGEGGTLGGKLGAPAGEGRCGAGAVCWGSPTVGLTLLSPPPPPPGQRGAERPDARRGSAGAAAVVAGTPPTPLARLAGAFPRGGLRGADLPLPRALPAGVGPRIGGPYPLRRLRPGP